MKILVDADAFSASLQSVLNERHLNKKDRRSKSKNHLKGPAKRTQEDDLRFAESFERMIKGCISSCSKTE